MEPTCAPKSRGVRAVEGAALGAVVGIVAGGLLGGIVFFTERKERNPRPAIFLALGIFGVAIVGQSIASAMPPEC